MFPGPTTQSSRTVYDECIQGDVRFDGVTESNFMTTLVGFPPSATELSGPISFGEAGESYLSEILNPSSDRGLTLMLGELSLFTRTAGSNLERFTGSVLLQGAYANLDPSVPPSRVDYHLGYKGTPFELEGVTQPDGNIAFDFRGDFRVDSTCGSGEGFVSTPQPLVVNPDTGAYVAGQMMINSGGANATYTYNGDGTITVTTAGGTQTYTESELAAVCNF